MRANVERTGRANPVATTPHRPTVPTRIRAPRGRDELRRGRGLRGRHPRAFESILARACGAQDQPRRRRARRRAAPAENHRRHQFRLESAFSGDALVLDERSPRTFLPTARAALARQRLESFLAHNPRAAPHPRRDPVGPTRARPFASAGVVRPPPAPSTSSETRAAEQRPIEGWREKRRREAEGAPEGVTERCSRGRSEPRIAEEHLGAPSLDIARGQPPATTSTTWTLSIHPRLRPSRFVPDSVPARSAVAAAPPRARGSGRVARVAQRRGGEGHRGSPNARANVPRPRPRPRPRTESRSGRDRVRGARVEHGDVVRASADGETRCVRLAQRAGLPGARRRRRHRGGVVGVTTIARAGPWDIREVYGTGPPMPRGFEVKPTFTSPPRRSNTYRVGAERRRSSSSSPPSRIGDARGSRVTTG